MNVAGTNQDSHIKTPDHTPIIERIRETVYEVRDLPTLPTVAHEVYKIISDPNSSMIDLVEILEEDVAISGRILRIANSAYYGVPRKIDNLKMALVILGMAEVNNLVTTISVLNLFSQQEGRAVFSPKLFWRHSAACAELTVGLYEGMGVLCPSGAYISGLLHDVGKLVLNQYFREYLVKCMNYADEHQVTLAEAELKLIGVDHGHIGSWLSKRWNIPDDVTQAIAQHHFRPPESPSEGLPTVIYWADRIYYIMEGRESEEIVKILDDDQEWREWFGDRGYPTTVLVNLLDERIKRSLKLVELID